ncbi:hypothetical protein Aple_031870 [Acrocarpospora pleiomorpha]|uniref:Uncharacterized protein n=1 Tax=Acrocarpospora pleiomorpha TaxID=90975 RepID=A0A5M3XKW0_9ACTN|nr:hypothetical protein [Acrocarpospora pleiomorpha]GES20291.1 hypothetical protein Aple_031870 [Acrocarpospora pleiomorpha]
MAELAVVYDAEPVPRTAQQVMARGHQEAGHRPDTAESLEMKVMTAVALSWFPPFSGHLT